MWSCNNDTIDLEIRCSEEDWYTHNSFFFTNLKGENSNEYHRCSCEKGYQGR